MAVVVGLGVGGGEVPPDVNGGGIVRQSGRVKMHQGLCGSLSP